MPVVGVLAEKKLGSGDIRSINKMFEYGSYCFT